MDIDVAGRIGAVTRSVGVQEHEGRPARVVVAARTYDTTAEDLWDALTNAERLPRWFMPVSGDLRLGGHYQLEGNAGGQIMRCDRPERLEVTWEFGGEVTWLSVVLEPHAAGGTLLELEHAAPVDDERWAQFGPGATGVGWDLALMGLAEHLASGATMDPQEAEAWSMSEEGRDFVRRSSEGWREASMEAGTDPAEAAAAADRTTAFYTGEPVDDVPEQAPGG